LPYPLLAHQALVLPLKMWRPNYFNGTALVIGSIAPDLQNFWSTGAAAIDFGHTFEGQFTFCLPLTIGVVAVIGYLRLGEVIASRFGRRFAWLSTAATDITRPSGLERAVMSAFAGSFSHIAFDALTHEAIPARAHYHVHDITFSMHSIAQAVASVVGALIALACLRKIASQRPSEVPARRPGAWALALGAFAGAAVGVRCALPAIRHPDWFFEAGRVYVWGYAAFLMSSAAAAGVVLVAVALRCWDRVSPNVIGSAR
jgi:hypothetical protein